MTNDQLKKLIETGIPIETAVFQTAVNNGHNTPENQFSSKSDNANRRAEMWATQADLLVFKHGGKIGFTPMANVKCGFFKAQTDHAFIQSLVDEKATDELERETLNSANIGIIKKRGRPFKTLKYDL